MLSNRTLGLLDIFFRINSFTGSFPFNWESETKTLTYTRSLPRRIYFHIFYTFIVFEGFYIPLSTIYHVATSTTESFLQNITGFLIDFVYSAGTISVSAQYTLVFRDKTGVALIFSQLIQFDVLSKHKFQELRDDKSKGNENDNEKSEYRDGIEPLLILWYSFIPIFAVDILGLYFINRGGHRNIFGYLGEKKKGDLNLMGIGIQDWIFYAGALWEFSIAFHRYMSFSFFLTYTFSCTTSYIFWLKFLRDKLKELKMKTRRKNQGFVDVDDVSNFKNDCMSPEEMFYFYRNMQLMNVSMNQSWRDYWFPALKTTNATFQVIGLYSIIKYHDKVHPFLLVFFTFMLVFGFIGFLAVFPKAAKVNTLSQEIIQSLKSVEDSVDFPFSSSEQEDDIDDKDFLVRKRQRKLEEQRALFKRRLASLRPLGFEVSSLYIIKKTTVLLYIASVYNSAVNLILLK